MYTILYKPFKGTTKFHICFGINDVIISLKNNDMPLSSNDVENAFNSLNELRENVELIGNLVATIEHDNGNVAYVSKFDTRFIFMHIFRDANIPQETLSNDDRAEVFTGILAGSSDLTEEMFQAVMDNYGAGKISSIIDKSPKIEIRQKQNVNNKFIVSVYDGDTQQMEEADNRFDDYNEAKEFAEKTYGDLPFEIEEEYQFSGQRQLWYANY